eukprot:GFYU01007806.1.p1 GENE.GFYU01007806.1~~GFYU01007806.1.p1  ORF type:complete len:593 (-),score=207.04 GFYU01007806.1:255-2033(-)
MANKLPAKPMINILPGYQFVDKQKPDPRTDYHAKPQYFNFKNGYHVENIKASDEELANSIEQIDMRNLTFRTVAGARDSAVAYAAFGNYPTVLPAHMAYDKLVCRFYGYFKEGISESPIESFRIRRVSILFYLEDDSIMVDEHRQDNTGLPQGVLVKRHRIPKNNSAYFSLGDFDIGNEITIYSKTIRIVDADKFTRDFFQNNFNKQIGQPEEIPTDHYAELLANKKKDHRPRKDNSMDKLKQFLDWDRHVLRFYCLWDDNESLFGSRRHFVLHYFLSDDTVSIKELHAPNSGREDPQFLKRTKLPKQSGRPNELYCASDFNVGETIHVFGREVFLYDCDDYTRRYMSQNFNYKCDPIPVVVQEADNPRAALPPHTGFGSEEDSLSSCMHLVPKSRKYDFGKFLDNEGKILRFLGRFPPEGCRPENDSRRFIITCYLEDDTIAVFEPNRRNSGFVCGKFLERGLIKREDGLEFEKNSRYIVPADLMCGVQIRINRYTFNIIDADQYTLKYMEDHCERFPCSNIRRVCGKIRTKAADVQAGLPSGQEVVTQSDVRNAISCVGLNAQEELTVMRHFDPEMKDNIRADQFAAESL